MAPKKTTKADKGQQKALEKQKQKIIEDKTFGLKNKNKSKTVQKYIKGIASQVKGGNVSESAVKAKELAQKEEKKKSAQQAALLNALFRGTENIKKIEATGPGAAAKKDPRSIKEEQQINLYVDQRDQQQTGKETMENWDQSKLEEVIKTKHTAENANRPTEIICKYFLDAVEKRVYGWFWQCPNGQSCKYRHCLPPGYVLKKDVPADEVDEEDETLIEELIEEERASLKRDGLTPVTLETFQAWKKRKEDDRLAALEEERQAEAKKTGGKGLGVMSGRDLFTYDPTLFVDDDDAADADEYDADEEYWNEQLAENERILREREDELRAEREMEAENGDDADDGGEGEDDDGDEDEQQDGDDDGDEGACEHVDGDNIDEDDDMPQPSSSSAAYPPDDEPSSSSAAPPPPHHQQQEDGNVVEERVANGVAVSKEELFLEDDVPDDLDALDD
ncbi:unnamed protein product [Vitrella brassicaformis CCMP3155]|uniref:C3H1-type domain-containing protein n=2 Tax=Vitrella brassicaformis TaxID=1169539 RepID=A0A0G4F6V3_VITBC|nr:unnamed protein product [Vitrella brassicaformis CCMP3155]|mmetsp:Transcript_53800/g.135233  ORF Transcript_53800/g.135233 Transcript_53800/m.135233 type:complete len:449 (+) Transcript_53800:261-1607(+)|eukprot:CEM07748.1 unnamed protein product [Vitrella brassicaformis CCMP3155]